MGRLFCAPVEADHNSRGRRGADGPVVGQTGARFGGAAGRRSRAPVEPPEERDAVAAQHRGTDQQVDPGQQVAEAANAQRAPQPKIAPPVPEPDGVNDVDWGRSKETYDLVRPYSWTGGRTASRVDLAVETLVSATGRAPDPPAGPEHRTILRLCATPHSVAELAALLSMPLGVARVLLGDLAAAGSVAIHRTVGTADAAPDVALMQRVLNGLQRL